MVAASGAPRRIVVFGVTGQLGQELVDRLDESGWPIAELMGVASGESVGRAFSFRGQELDVVGEWPVLKGRDLVFVSTRGISAMEIVRECLRAEVACLDLTGALADQAEVPMPFAVDEDEAVRQAPLIAQPSPTAFAWAAVVTALGGAEGVRRVVGTVFSSASAQGREGVVALSEESIALFNQSAEPEPGPAGQPVAFDVVPAGSIDEGRLRTELARRFGDALGVGVEGLQVPTFAGEGSALTIELTEPLERDAVVARLLAHPVLQLVAEGLGSRGLAAVEDGVLEPTGPTMRDAVGTDEVLVGRLEPDPSLEAGRGWRLWIATDPVRLAAEQALRIAGRRLGLE